MTEYSEGYIIIAFNHVTYGIQTWLHLLHLTHYVYALALKPLTSGSSNQKLYLSTTQSRRDD